MGVVAVKGVRIGEGKPKICVPLVGATLAALREEAAFVETLSPDLVELRIDLFESWSDPEAAVRAVREVAASLGGIPLLFTCRTKAEGGAADIAPSRYAALNAAACASGAVDLLDVELFSPSRDECLAAARARGVVSVVSSHDFERTPPVPEMVSRLVEAARLGDIAKLAVMPGSIGDVLALLSATVEARKAAGATPLATMSMGPLGAVSRLSGEAFGSAFTFGSAKKASAPGQVPAERLRVALDIVHDAMGGTK